MDLITLKSLEVEVAGRTLVTSDNLKVLLDLDKYGVKESGVLFHVIQAPSHGRLEVSVWNKANDNIFTLLDLNTDKVSYFLLRICGSVRFPGLGGGFFFPRAASKKGGAKSGSDFRV